MATVGDSPTRCLGQSWTSWAQRVGLGVPYEDSEDDDHDGSSKKEGDSMKLRREDMPLFGFCPARDDFYLVVCELCHQVVKPQALHNHIQLRHSKSAFESVLSSNSSGHQKSEVQISMPKNISYCYCFHHYHHHHNASHLHSPLSKEMTDCGDSFSSSLEPQSTAISETTSLASTAANLTVSSYVTSQHNLTFTQQHPARESNIEDPILFEDKDAVSNLLPSSVKSHSLSSPVVRVERMMPCVITKVATGMVPPIFAMPAAVQVDKSESQYLQDPLPPLTLAESLMPAANPVHLPISPKTTPSTPNSFTRMPSSHCSPLMYFSQRSPNKSGFLASVSEGKLKPSKSKSKEPKERKLLPCKDRVYDPDKHCGVFVQEAGKQCTRSLTCKTHSVAMRRNVAGRKKHFDELLAEHRATKETLLRANKGISERIHTRDDGRQWLTPNFHPDDCSTENNVSDVASLDRISIGGSNKTSIAGKLNHVGNHESNCTVSNCGVMGHRVYSSIFPATAKCKPHISYKSSGLVTALQKGSHFATDYDTPWKSIHAGKFSAHQQTIGDDYGCLMCHPKPAAACSFNTRQMGLGFYVYNRRLDNIRAVLRTTLGERVPLPSKIKKLCVESRLPPVPEPCDPSDPYCFTVGDQQMMPQQCNKRIQREDQSSNEGTNSFCTKRLMALKTSGQQISLVRLKEKQGSESGTLSSTVYSSSKCAPDSLIESSNNLASTSGLVPAIPSLLSVSDKAAGPHSPSVKRKRSVENKNGKDISSNYHTSLLPCAPQQLLSVATTTSGTTGLLPMTLSVSLNAKLTTAPHFRDKTDCSFAPLMVATSGSNLSANATQSHLSVPQNASKDLMAHLEIMNGQFISETMPCLNKTRVGASCLLSSSNSAMKGALTSRSIGLATPGLALRATFAAGLNHVSPLTNSSNIVLGNVSQHEHQTMKHSQSPLTGRIGKVLNVNSITESLVSSEAKGALMNSNNRVPDIVSVTNVGQRSEVQSVNSHLTYPAVSVEAMSYTVNSPSPISSSKVLVTGNLRTVTHPSHIHHGQLSHIGNSLHLPLSVLSTSHETVVNHITPSSSTAFAVSPQGYSMSPSTELLLPNSQCINASQGIFSNEMVSSRPLLVKKSDYQHRHAKHSAILSSTHVNVVKESSIRCKLTTENKSFHDGISSSSPHFSLSDTSANRHGSSVVSLGSSNL